MTEQFRIFAVAIVFAMVAASGFWVGEEHIQAKWDKQTKEQTEQRIQDERVARSEEQHKAADAIRITDEQAQSNAIAAADAASAQRTIDSLRGTIVRLNSRTSPSDSEAAGYAREASIARELLNTCSARYASLAAEADGLRIQTRGLIDWSEAEVK
ncbi:DUF2514 family protein [Polynucleobacter sp. UK-Kesae-W10]|uniref:DUF2514 family protein n=1 Tax=Polynucleobacter sp. UK-Kesae-W10 TaxID=1819738 RepID=UPI001C0D8754|nr:DUF2514 family protein [Polynucleobacter sp. UK-Kesae-W10]MBU3577565.1 DUF2514 family protein [Polynucleobacter sp. UK-Kesae-W10]